MITTDGGKDYLTKKEVAAMLGVSMTTMNRMIAANRIPFIRVKTFTGTSKRVRFDRRAINTWLLEKVFL